MASTKRSDKPCEGCGVLLVNVVAGRKYCYECAKKRQREYQRAYAIRERSKKGKSKAPQVPTANPNKEYCKGCVYWGCRHYVGNSCCNYIFIEGHSRGCPPGKDCTKRHGSNRK